MKNGISYKGLFLDRVVNESSVNYKLLATKQKIYEIIYMPLIMKLLYFSINVCFLFFASGTSV